MCSLFQYNEVIFKFEGKFKMKIEIPEIQHTPFVTVPRFSEMTGLSIRQVRHLIDVGYLPVVKLTDGKQVSKSHYVNLLQIQKALLSKRTGEVNLNIG